MEKQKINGWNGKGRAKLQAFFLRVKVPLSEAHQQAGIINCYIQTDSKGLDQKGKKKYQTLGCNQSV